MMMAKPAPEQTSEEAPPAFATAPETKKLTEVEKLEQRLQLLGGMGAPKEPAPVEMKQESAPPVVAAPPPAAATAAPSGGGKQALLARIMAAKEKNKPKAPPQPQAPPVDLLSDFDAPSTEKDPPPSFDTNFLPPPPMPAAPAEMPPPAFDSVQNNIMNQAFPPPPPIDSVLPPPPSIDSVAAPPPFSAVAPPAMAPSAPAASAPFFEDLMDQQQPNHLAGMQAVPPPEAPPEIDDSFLAGLDPKEREELLAEQKKIMEQIEKDKQNNSSSEATARAMAFNQRSSAAVAEVAGNFDRPASRSAAARPKKAKAKSSSASGASSRTVAIGEGEEVPLHGQETTQQAIKDGTALVVQCINCQNWMQVAENANLMFCPVCQVVSPVEKEAAATAEDMEAAAQLAADAQLAEKLQNEEYARGAGGETRRPRQKKPAQGKVQSGQSWYDWIVGTPVEQPPAASVPDRGSAELPSRRGPGLVPATTGAADGVGRSRSYDESESLVGGGGARVAESKSMFACVADSISTAANQMTAVALNQDDEGNVHGVDSSSLLAMSNVSRQRD